MRWYLLVVLAFLCAGCGFLESSTASLEDVENFIGVPLPEDATDIHYYAGGFQDTIIWLRFDTTPESLTDFVTALAFDEPLGSDYRPLMNPAPPELEWWTPDEVQHFIGGSYFNMEANLNFDILADTERWRVYLIVFNT